MNNHYAAPQSDVSANNQEISGGISSAMLDAMRGTKPWVLLIGIVLIIISVFMVLGTIGVFAASMMSMGTKGPPESALLGIGAMYALFSVVYIILAIYLIKYSSAIGRLVQSANVTDMEDALHSQRKFWRLAGILTAVMLALMVLGFLAAIIIPIAMR